MDPKKIESLASKKLELSQKIGILLTSISDQAKAAQALFYDQRMVGKILDSMDRAIDEAMKLISQYREVSERLQKERDSK